MKRRRTRSVDPIMTCPVKETVFRFLEEVVDELVKIFPETVSISAAMRLPVSNGRNVCSVRGVLIISNSKMSPTIRTDEKMNNVSEV